MQTEKEMRDALVALQNMKANGFDLGLEEEDYLALDLAIEALAAPVDCAGCEGTPAEGNSPCAVCGRTTPPAAAMAQMAREVADRADRGQMLTTADCARLRFIATELTAAPRGGSDESKELLDAKVIDSLIVANEEWQAVAAKLAACLSDAIAGGCPIPLFHASSAALQGYAALATGEQP